jgi:hypothetical protein
MLRSLETKYLAPGEGSQTLLRLLYFTLTALQGGFKTAALFR